jgi:hypothetical protein
LGPSPGEALKRPVYSWKLKETNDIPSIIAGTKPEASR